MVLTVALLVGQSHVFVLAEEGAQDAPQTEISSEESTENMADGSNTEDPDSGLEDGNQESEDGKGSEDGEKTENPQEGEETPEDDGKNAEEEVNPEEEKGEEEAVSENDLDEEETVSENDLDEAMDVSLLSADEGVETLAVGDTFDYTYEKQTLKYRIIGEGEVEVYKQLMADGDLVIPAKVKSKDGIEYKVIGIARAAFAWGNVVNVKIEEGLLWLSDSVFCDCKNLISIKLPNSVERIGRAAFGSFEGVTNLKTIQLPEKLTIIEEATFHSASGLTEIVIPKNVTIIDVQAFFHCFNLETVTIPSGVTELGAGVFNRCESLKELKIVVYDPQTPIEAIKNIGTIVEDVPAPPFGQCPEGRKIVFQNADGSDLTGEPFEQAKQAYLEAGKNDDDPEDGLWWGWAIQEPEVHKVTVNVNIDGQTWNNHEKTFALTKDGREAFVTNLDVVGGGTYTIYDVTGLTADEFGTKGVNTGVTVTVTDADVTATVEYYTATFYDGTEAYKPKTPQEPQIVLSGQRVTKPADPVKDEQQFAGWKTENGGSTPYDFTATVTKATSIYASWVEMTAEQVHITATAGEGGTIDPVGDIAVTKGGERTFTITPNEGKKIKAVTVDGSDVTAELADTLTRAQTGARYYTFTNVTQNHTIHADFENSSGGSGGGDDNPGGGDSGGGDDNPGGGGSGGGDDNPDSGGDTGIAQTVVAVKTAAPQAETKQSAASNGKEPKTGDATHIEVYATIAMIAGLSYLLLYFMEEGRGMTEREKEVFVAAFIRWGKKGGAFRRGCAIVVIFCLLAYYHSIGKRAGGNVADGRYLGQTS